MKKLLYISIIGIFAACGTETTPIAAVDNSQLDDLKMENIELKNNSARKDSMINSYALYINEIQTNLAAITGKQGLVNAFRSNGEFSLMASEEEMVDHIKSINELMAKSDSRTAQLKADLAAANLDMVEFEKLIIGLSEEVATKNMEIFALQQELENIDGAYSELFIAIEEKQDIIDEQTDMLNAAWYSVGSSKELRNNDVITKEGGLLGIGKTNKLKADLNHDYFTEIDITTMTEITLGGKSAEILTSHPSGSYEVTGEDQGAEKLVILDVEKFWSVSKYLVVVLD
ncbi:MAG: hypothetical protein ACI9J3_002474 [Parvicellaceae bacterium]|jgi:hypothetical protein